MPDPAHHWRWLVNGFGGLVGMCMSMDADGPPMTAAQISQLRGYLASLEAIAAKQERQAAESGLAE